MTPTGLPVLPRDGLPPLVLVVPVLKVFPHVVERTVDAVACVLRQQGPVAVVDIFQGDTSDGGTSALERCAGRDRSTSGFAVDEVVPSRIVVGGELSAALSSVAELVAACERLLAEKRAVVLVGPPAVQYDDRFWLYAGVAQALADHVVLCTDGHLLEHGGTSFGELLLGPRSAAARWSSLAVVEDADPVCPRARPSPTLRMADVVLSDDVTLEWPLGHLLGVFGLPPAGQRGPAVAPVVHTVLEACLGPLSEWDTDDAELDAHASPDARCEAFVDLLRSAAAVVQRYGPWLLQSHPAPDRHRVLDALLRCVPTELRRVTALREPRELAFAVLDLAAHLVAYADTHDDVPLDERYLAGGALAVGWSTGEAITAIVRASGGDRALQVDLARRAADLGPAMELFVLRALHQAHEG